MMVLCSVATDDDTGGWTIGKCRRTSEWTVQTVRGRVPAAIEAKKVRLAFRRKQGSGLVRGRLEKAQGARLLATSRRDGLAGALLPEHTNDDKHNANDASSMEDDLAILIAVG